MLLQQAFLVRQDSAERHEGDDRQERHGEVASPTCSQMDFRRSINETSQSKDTNSSWVSIGNWTTVECVLSQNIDKQHQHLTKKSQLNLDEKKTTALEIICPIFSSPPTDTVAMSVACVGYFAGPAGPAMRRTGLERSDRAARTQNAVNGFGKRILGFQMIWNL